MLSLSQYRASSILLVGTTVDQASVNLVSCLTNRASARFKELSGLSSSSGRVWQTISSISNKQSDVYVWLQDDSLLNLNYPDQLFQKEYKNELQITDFSDIIFLSKHSATSGIASLTVHPIGVPWTTDVQRSGGLPGRCSPPSFRIASLYRALSERVDEIGMSKTYQVS